MRFARERVLIRMQGPARNHAAVLPLARRVGLAGLVIFLAAAGTGCRHTAAPPEQTRSSVRFVEPPPRAKGKSAPTPTTEVATRRVFAAEPIEPLAVPAYPKIPRGERPPVVLVGLRITVDPAGRVSEIGSSLRAFSTPHARAAEFRAAAETALAQWRFNPAELHQLEQLRGPGGQQGYMRVAGFEFIEWNYDVVFTFNASGDVGVQR